MRRSPGGAALGGRPPGHGVGDATALAGEARRLLATMESAGRVAEQPEAHIVPHVRAAAGGLAAARALAVAVVGAFVEGATLVRQRPGASHGLVELDVVRGMLAGDGPFAPHGHRVLLRLLLDPPAGEACASLSRPPARSRRRQACRR